MKSFITITNGMSGLDARDAINQNNSIDMPGITVGSSDITTKLFNYNCDGTADEVQINLAIEEAAALANGGCVYLSPGIFNIADSIIIKTNVSLISTTSTKIFLSNTSNHYMVVNDDFDNGTTDFTIIGGRWDGNRNQQTKNYTGNPEETFWGFGFMFKNAERFYVGDMYISSTSSWGIAHFLCTDLVFKNIEFAQLSGGNGDGITGTGPVNLIIDNIYGYTSDDMIAVVAMSSILGSVKGNYIEWGTGRDAENITISNIQCRENSSGTNTYAAIGLYSGEDMTISNVLIHNVSGGIISELAFIHCINYWPELGGKGNIKNLDIRNLNIQTGQINQPALEFSDFDVMVVSDLNLDGVKYVNNVDAVQWLIKFYGSVANANINNITAKNEVGTNQHLLLLVDGSGQAISLNLNAIDVTSDIDPNIWNTGVSIDLRVNAPECYTNTFAQVNGSVIGDRLAERVTFHPMLYTTKWIDIIDGSDI